MTTETQFELRLRAILAGYSLPGSLITMGTTTLRVYLKNADGDVLQAEGNVVPPDTGTGYAKGCIFIKTDALTTVRGAYENIGTKTSCVFQKMGGARVSDVELTAGKLIYGVAPGIGAEKTLSITVVPLTSVAKLFEFIDVEAESVSVHAAVQEGSANAFPGPFTSPVIPRSIKITFAAGWQGGDITVIGTDQFNAAVTEVIADNPGSVVQGVKIFKTITAISKETIAGTVDTCEVFTSVKIGIPSLISAAFGILTCDAVVEAVTLDSTYPSFVPTTPPDGGNDYCLMINVPHSSTPVFT